MIVVSSPLHALHEPLREVTGGREKPAIEVGARATSILAAIEADGGFECLGPEAFGLEPILAVHDPGLVRYLETAWDEWRTGGTGGDSIVPDTIRHPGLRPTGDDWPEPDSPCGRVGYWTFDTATPIVEGTWRATCSAVDVALTAAARVADGAAAAYGLCRPPGHHAARDLFGGYCYLNNAAIAAEWLRQADRRAGGHPRSGLPPRQRHPGHLLGAAGCPLRLAPCRPARDVSVLHRLRRRNGVAATGAART